MSIKKKNGTWLAVAVLAVAMAAPSQSSANVLYLTMDASGSINDAEWDLQVNGYVNALNTVLGGGSFFADTAIGVSIFSAGVSEVFGLQAIGNAADLASLTTAIGNTVTGGSNDRGGLFAGATAIGDAINGAAAAIQGFDPTDNNKVIDVSTDGFSNTGNNPVTEAANATVDNILTNCLGVGAGANCSFATGFSTLISDFGGFETALTDKLEMELSANPIPVPAAIWLFGSALLGLVGMARKKAT